MTYLTRSCCGTVFSVEHRTDCPAEGVVARGQRACVTTPDGWCASHSTGTGPAYCS